MRKGPQKGVFLADLARTIKGFSATTNGHTYSRSLTKLENGELGKNTDYDARFPANDEPKRSTTEAQPDAEMVLASSAVDSTPVTHETRRSKDELDPTSIIGTTETEDVTQAHVASESGLDEMIAQHEAILPAHGLGRVSPSSTLAVLGTDSKEMTLLDVQDVLRRHLKELHEDHAYVTKVGRSLPGCSK